MLRVAVPNKGSLSETASQMLAEAGYSGRRDPKSLYLADERNGVEFFYLRPRDIATYVGSGALDVGITGRDLLLDSGSSATEVSALDFGSSTFRFAGPAGKYHELSDLEGVRIATSYAGLVGAFLESHGVHAQLIGLDGAVESAVQLGVADAIADVVETGTTLRAAGLEIFGPVILRSTAVLISRAGSATGPDADETSASDETAASDVPGLDVLRRRLHGVLVARQYVMMDYDLPVRLLDEATRIAPGIESPTVAPLHDPEWAAVRVMVSRSDMNQIMDALYDLGARAILVTPIHAARL